jgi:hypothetical protein
MPLDVFHLHGVLQDGHGPVHEPCDRAILVDSRRGRHAEGQPAPECAARQHGVASRCALHSRLTKGTSADNREPACGNAYTYTFTLAIFICIYTHIVVDVNVHVYFKIGLIIYGEEDDGT